ncbi:MAG: hypothetical protein VX938_05630, partial [Myxococcota bacterium]|nr:hypothetical protein [Myxococcota bacterium]
MPILASPLSGRRCPIRFALPSSVVLIVALVTGCGDPGATGPVCGEGTINVQGVCVAEVDPDPRPGYDAINGDPYADASERPVDTSTTNPELQCAPAEST